MPPVCNPTKGQYRLSGNPVKTGLVTGRVPPPPPWCKSAEVAAAGRHLPYTAAVSPTPLVDRRPRFRSPYPRFCSGYFFLHFPCIFWFFFFCIFWLFCLVFVVMGVVDVDDLASDHGRSAIEWWVWLTDRVVAYCVLFFFFLDLMCKGCFLLLVFVVLDGEVD